MGAPKGNQNALGNNGGAPPLHDDPIVFDNLIKGYFKWIEGEPATEDKNYTWERKPEPPTVTGLTLYLGFADKKSLYDYKKKVEFVHSIKRAVTRIEQWHEIQIAHGDKCTGNIFALKNFGWSDRSEIDLKTTVHMEKLSEEEIEKRLIEIAKGK